MAKELFSMAAQENKGSARENKRRKRFIFFCSIFAIAFIVQGLFHLKDFPLHIPFQQTILIHENQVALMKAVIAFSLGLAAFGLSIFLLRPAIWSMVLFLSLSVFMAGSIVYSDLAGFEIVRRRGLSSAYALCLFLPIAAVALIISQMQKHDHKEE